MAVTSVCLQPLHTHISCILKTPLLVWHLVLEPSCQPVLTSSPGSKSSSPSALGLWSLMVSRHRLRTPAAASASTADAVACEVLGEHPEREVHISRGLGLQPEAVDGLRDHLLVLQCGHAAQEESCGARGQRGGARGGARGRARGGARGGVGGVGERERGGEGGGAGKGGVGLGVERRGGGGEAGRRRRGGWRRQGGGGGWVRTRDLFPHGAAWPPRGAAQLVQPGRGGQHAHAVTDCGHSSTRTAVMGEHSGTWAAPGSGPSIGLWGAGGRARRTQLVASEAVDAPDLELEPRPPIDSFERVVHVDRVRPHGHLLLLPRSSGARR